MKYKILYFGTWGYGLAGLEALYQLENVEIVKVYTKYDLTTRNDYLNKVYDFSSKNNLSFFNSDKITCKKSEFETNVLSNMEIDFIVSCCFDRIFSKKIIGLPNISALNVHPSLLPQYRGIKPLENAIVNNEKSIGVTIHELISELDAGDIILQKASIEIKLIDTYSELYNKQCNLIAELLKFFFSKSQYYLEHKQKQINENVSFAPRLPIEIYNEDTVVDIIRKYKLSNNANSVNGGLHNELH